MRADRRKDSKKRVLKEGEYQRSNGSFEYKWRDKTGKRRSVYAKTLDELREKETAILRNTLNGVKTPDTNICVNDLYEAWAQLKRGLKDNTFQNYKYMYTQFVQPTFGKMKICKIKRSDVRSFYNHLADEQHLKTSTIDCIHTVVHQVLELGVEDEYLRSNPADGALKELKKAHNQNADKRKALTLAEQELFENFLKNSTQYNRWYPLFTVMLWTGMRVGELTGLRWCDVDFEDDTISINHTLVYYNRNGEKSCAFAVNTPKAKVLRRIIRDCNYDVLDKGGKVTLPRFSNHSLGHSFTTRMCEAGVNVKAMQDILGHADAQTTLQIYADATEDLKRSEMGHFAEYFDRKTD